MSIFVIIIYRSLLECLVVVGLQGNLLHGHYIARLVVYGSVDFPEVTLAYSDVDEGKIQNMKKILTDLDPTLPGEANKSCLDVDSVFGLCLV